MRRSKLLIITHGRVTHSLDDRYDCLTCIEMELEYLKAIKKAGGLTKFAKMLHERKL